MSCTYNKGVVNNYGKQGGVSLLKCSVMVKDLTDPYEHKENVYGLLSNMWKHFATPPPLHWAVMPILEVDVDYP